MMPFVSLSCAAVSAVVGTFVWDSARRLDDRVLRALAVLNWAFAIANLGALVAQVLA